MELAPADQVAGEKLIGLLHNLAESCARQMECIETGKMDTFDAHTQTKEHLIRELADLAEESQREHIGFGDMRSEIQQALNAYMALEAGVQKALSGRSGEIAEKLIVHYRARLGQEGYDNVSKLFTPIARLFPGSSRYVDERR